MNTLASRPDEKVPINAEAASRPNAAPPPCPRCELVKSQCTKTVINYQKSHRKKIEALRSELKSSRQQVERLQRQLRFYNATSRIVPAVVLLAGAVWIFLRRQMPASKSTADEQQPVQQPAAVDSGADI